MPESLRSTEIDRDLQRSTEIYRDRQRSTEIYRDRQRSTEIYRDRQRSTEIGLLPCHAARVHSGRRVPWRTPSGCGFGFGRSVASLVLVVATLPTPHERARADSSCDPGEFCVWGNIDFVGDFWDPVSSDANWPCGVLCSPDVDNNDDSVRNRRSGKVHVEEGTNYKGGVVYCVAPGVEEDSIHSARDDRGDSSLHFAATSCAGYPVP